MLDGFLYDILPMQVRTYSDARANLKTVMDQAIDNHEPIIITGKRGPCVLMSLEDWNAMDETAYLLSSPKNAERLSAAITELDRGENSVIFESIDALEDHVQRSRVG